MAAVAALAVAALALPAPRLAAQEVVPAEPAQSAPEGMEEGQAGAAAEVLYRVEISGVEDDGLRDLLQRSSRLAALADRPPPTRAALERRAEADAERLVAVLRAEGYYAATVTPRLGASAESEPVPVTLEATPGPRYVIGRYAIAYVRPLDEDLPSEAASFGFEPGMPARSESVVDIEARLLAHLANMARPLAKAMDRQVVVDHASRTMTVDLSLDQGPRVWFGDVRVQGLNSVREEYLLRQLPFEPGALYRQAQVDLLRERLVESGLFATVSIERGPMQADGAVPIEVAVVERPHRSVGAGISYSTTEGPGANLFWQHRNVAGGHETVTVNGRASGLRQHLTIDGRSPDHGRPGQDLVGTIEGRHQDTDAYRELGGSTAIGIERPLAKAWRASAGLLFEYSKLDEFFGRRDVYLAGMPAALTFDNTLNPLDPTSGARLSLHATPFGGSVGGNSATFVVTEALASAYWPVGGDDMVFALRGRVGSAFGENQATIPATKRFYAGGGGSVRGFGFQKVGPLDADNDPIGGKSVVEAGAELRFKISEKFGVVPFVEGGNVRAGSVPDPFEAWRWSAGLGLRYYTPIGPLRIDVAVPINRRSGIDDAFQFYISLGQAF